MPESKDAAKKAVCRDTPGGVGGEGHFLGQKCYVSGLERITIAYFRNIVYSQLVKMVASTARHMKTIAAPAIAWSAAGYTMYRIRVKSK